MSRKVLILTATCVAMLAIAGCGRKGSLEPPGTSAAPAIHLPA